MKTPFVFKNLKSVPENLEPTWGKDRAIAGIQEIIRNLPLEDKTDFGTWAKYFEMWGKMTGVFGAASLEPETKNIFVLPHEESDEVWAERLKKEQTEAHQRAAKDLATDTRSTNTGS